MFTSEIPIKRDVLLIVIPSSASRRKHQLRYNLNNKSYGNVVKNNVEWFISVWDLNHGKLSARYLAEKKLDFVEHETK